ncbi:uncharacterized protein LOC110456119 [Mizuhopecten yessoensis]|uniref:uncharacterized protein LOC110456119 n=1 Tax=Mizuhopecten yessoensis TaxID=6573 RepID=UPI000B458E67|nr:uncharacterized protein LOC110456119 [Mizuhopecten yessoensis]
MRVLLCIRSTIQLELAIFFENIYQMKQNMDTNNDRIILNIIMIYMYCLAEVCVLELLNYAEDQNQCALELDLVAMNTVLMNTIGIHQIGNPMTMYHNHWTRDASYDQDDIVHRAARTRLYIAQEYIRQLVSNGEPISTIPERIRALFKGSKPCVMPGTRHIYMRRFGSTLKW